MESKITNRCVNKLRAEVIMEKVDPAEALEYIKNNSSEVYEIPDGFALRGITLLGKPPLHVGLKLKKKEILFYFNKPCFGWYLYKLKASDEDFAHVRECGKKI